MDAVEPTAPAAPATPTAATSSTTATDDAETLVDDELLVEEISIDGMCGVY